MVTLQPWVPMEMRWRRRKKKRRKKEKGVVYRFLGGFLTAHAFVSHREPDSIEAEATAF
jgi:hypothetical protein